MKWSKLSHVGLVRKNNEDNCCVCDDLQLLAVADGMGGHKAGEVASKLALDAISGYLRKNSAVLEEDPIEALQMAFRHANTTVYEYAQKDRENFRGMGTTVTAALIRGEKVYIAHVGDSRAYLVRGSVIKLLTSDHSLVNELLLNGSLTEEEAENHPQKNVLTRAIGTAASVDVDVVKENVIEEDIILLCTDGLSNMINVEEIGQMAGAGETLGARARHFIDKALDRGGDDNITVVLYQAE
ncbi:Stp1/IreP family PP2C-type Ser/Thr phosphatase [Phosphitispora fastidiosa]|uniref:Stp1/IreP family PP2C-type Ser/Thr phosphatase n=1 Tax=Phosphitispora fastidiosa TaxID=2837202 RepID=UPI001E37459E|nr:Stp1/IreP family PP2C-type Ser/Thr phosphatase [Phosphitispora fastidiosa]MBU7006620.1 protein phosphatase [Phosphitispora fastidiosa]